MSKETPVDFGAEALKNCGPEVDNEIIDQINNYEKLRDHHKTVLVVLRALGEARRLSGDFNTVPVFVPEHLSRMAEIFSAAAVAQDFNEYLRGQIEELPNLTALRVVNSVRFRNWCGLVKVTCRK